MSGQIFCWLAAFARGQFTWSTFASRYLPIKVNSKRCPNQFSVGPLHCTIAPGQLQKCFCLKTKLPVAVTCHPWSSIPLPGKDIFGTKYIFQYYQMSGDRVTLLLRAEKGFGQKAIVVIHYQLHNRSRLHRASAIDLQRSEKNQPALFDHWPEPLGQNTCKPCWTRLSVCPYLFQEGRTM